ncbi:gamma-glutamylcyclotransferase family protein [Mucilaginibacter sp. X4EP1]|uniref:gamma-glutamylcyclotransferase family protein n=1 Tax=Mucilaginibacter sp. X4EP1 TaxID=2723092 RepID=UPI00216940BF|nr:gamma-glutamylcyclotransferase family protein [Mucilaginibacter sp. X4EP1]MCS3814821.1 gamma-glutamylcyclotransferase (GGCT)/AIG2-like uncharacterized protein YtfP [Mucilaginibacter sp. X4EP1]
MDKNDSYLFVYGSLLDDSNEFAVYLKQNCTFYNKGKFEGKLYDIGLYPGAILAEGCDSYVYGSILVINNPVVAFKVLDDYEGFGTDQTYPNEFIRELVNIDITTTKLYCWVYLYNLPVDELPQIVSGDYLAFKK